MFKGDPRIVRHATFAFMFVFSCFGSQAFADAQADADYIVSQTVTREMFAGALNAQRPLITGAMQNNLRAKGIQLPDPDRFFDFLMSEFLDEFTETMQGQTSSIYLDNFSEKQLQDIADFFRTDSGQAFIAATPKLMLEGARMGQIAGQAAGANAGKRLAARIKEEGLIVVDDPGLLSRLLDALR